MAKLFTLIVGIITYLLFSLVAWDINIANWHWAVRLFYVLIVVVVFIVAGFFSLMTSVSKTEAKAKKNNL